VNLYFWGRALCALILRIKGIKVEGRENIPEEGPIIIACNHISLWDPVIVGCTMPRQVFFMAKEGLFEKPVLGRLLKGLGTFPVKRGRGDISAIKTSLAILKDNKVLGIFPEGTRSKSGDIQEAMAGIVLIMEKSRAPVLPVRVYGSRGLLSEKRGIAGIIIGEPVYAHKLSVPAGVENRRQWLANEIMRIVNQI